VCFGLLNYVDKKPFPKYTAKTLTGFGKNPNNFMPHANGDKETVFGMSWLTNDQTVTTTKHRKTSAFLFARRNNSKWIKPPTRKQNRIFSHMSRAVKGETALSYLF
jgi:hypothetical protein